MPTEPWRALFDESEPAALLAALSQPAGFVARGRELCRLLEDYMADHRVPLSPWPFGKATSFREAELTEAIDLHWLLERLQTRAEAGQSITEHRSELKRRFEAFQASMMAYLNPDQVPAARRRKTGGKIGAGKTNAKKQALRDRVQPEWQKWHTGKMPEHQSQADFARWAARAVCADEIVPRTIENWSKAWAEAARKARNR